MYPKYQIIITSTCNQYKILRFLQCMCVYLLFSEICVFYPSSASQPDQTNFNCSDAIWGSQLARWEA